MSFQSSFELQRSLHFCVPHQQPLLVEELQQRTELLVLLYQALPGLLALSLLLPTYVRWPRNGVDALLMASLGVASSGIHSNGFSLVRRLIADLDIDIDQPAPFDASQTLRQALLAPTVLYGASVHRALQQVPGAIKALCHVTGGGLPGNLNRVLREDLAAHVDPSRWQAAPIFGWLESLDRVEAMELYRTFNMGLGMVLAVDAEQAGSVMAQLAGDAPVFEIGTLTERASAEAVPVHIAGVTA